jgi:SAM-dependent methyltransferase
MSVMHGSLLALARTGLQHPRLARSRRIALSVLRRTDLRSAQKALLVSETLSSEEKRLISRVPMRIHPNDDMYRLGTGRHYLSIGLSARRCIMVSLAHAQQNSIRTILDLPSGYGRILRILQLSFPNSTVWGCEIVPEAVHFVQKQFNVNAAVSNTDFTKVSFPIKFDLIWSGSLLTHLDANNATELLRLFHRSLSPTGVCVFTMHGQTSAAWLDSRAETYGLKETAIQTVLSDFADKGYGYADYSANAGYGIALATRARMVQMASAVGDWNFLSFHERMWTDHHDVYAFSKGPAIVPLIVEARDPIPAPNMFRWVL